MRKFVCDTSALLNIKEPNETGFSPAYSLWKDLSDRWIEGPVTNIIPAIAMFELSASVSRKHREGHKILREFRLFGEDTVLYPMDRNFVQQSAPLFAESGFDQLRGADLAFACIARIEHATLVTCDSDFDKVADKIDVLDLNESRDYPHYRKYFEMT